MMFDDFRILLQACPLYIAEVAPKTKRGGMISILVSFTLIASVVSCFSNSLYNNYVQMNKCLPQQAGNVINFIMKRFLFGWRISFSVPILVSTILIIGTLFIPETPRQVENLCLPPPILYLFMTQISTKET